MAMSAIFGDDDPPAPIIQMPHARLPPSPMRYGGLQPGVARTASEAGSTRFGNVLDVRFWPKAGEAAMAALLLVCRPSHRHNLLKNIDAFCRTARSRCSPAHCTSKAFRMRELPCSTEQYSTEQYSTEQYSTEQSSTRQKSTEQSSTQHWLTSTEQFRSVRLAYPADPSRSAR